MSRTLRIARIAADAAIRLLPLIAGVLLLAIGLGPRTGLYRTVTVLTGSMEPSIPAGAVVVVRPVPAYSIDVGDVITFNAPIADSRVVTHRVVATQQRDGHIYVRTKGDANNGPDPWFARIDGRSAWKVAAVVPHAGRALSFLREKWMRLLGVLVLPIVLAFVWLRDIWRRPEHEPATVEILQPAPAATHAEADREVKGA